MRQYLASFCLVFTLMAFSHIPLSHANTGDLQSTFKVAAMFDRLDLQGKLPLEVFQKGVQEYQRVEARQPYLTIIDYTKPSSIERLFVFNMETEELLFNTHVAHGKNSGAKYATQFSNTVNSKQTSLGVFLTSDTYWGGNGYSLRLDGLTPGLNDNARKRYIVIHGADYAEESFIRAHGRLGRSWGCPALPNSLARVVIDTIKDGSVIYAHG